MSDLHCPVRIFLARHGETEYESDLLLGQGGSLTALGRAQARGLGERLRGERIAHVYSSTVSRAVQTAELAAGVLGVQVTTREGLHEFALGDARGQPAGEGVFTREMEAWVAGDVGVCAPGSESALDVADRVSAVLDDVADRHRGEAVLVVAHGGMMVATLAVLDFRPGRSWDVANCASVLLERDADGWRSDDAPAVGG
jgi:broad specificity phosphatase PhoE